MCGIGVDRAKPYAGAQQAEKELDGDYQDDAAEDRGPGYPAVRVRSDGSDRIHRRRASRSGSRLSVTGCTTAKPSIRCGATPPWIGMSGKPKPVTRCRAIALDLFARQLIRGQWIPVAE